MWPYTYFQPGNLYLKHVVGPIVVLIMVFLCSDFRSPFASFYHSVSEHMCFTVRFHLCGGGPNRQTEYLCNLELHQN